MDKNEKLAWAAGYLTARGTLILKAGRTSLRLKTTKRGEGLAFFAQCLDLRIASGKVNGKAGDQVTLSGRHLHEVMTKLWPYLPMERKREYARIRKAAAQ